VKNIFGFSLGYSPVSQFKSATAPDSPQNITTLISGRNVKVEWVPQNNNYDQITRFDIQILNKSNAWLGDTLTCDGASPDILQNNYCLIPLSILTGDNFDL
jgi:hypothetical protein